MPLPPDPVLASSPPFAALEPALLARVASELEPVRLAAGETLMRQGDPGDAMYVLVDGTLEVRVAHADGDVDVDRLRPGASVGEMALVAGGRRSATVVAVGPAELLKLSRATFERLASDAPELVDAVAREAAPRLQRVQLSGVLEAWFGDLDREGLHALQERLAWVRLAAGETLYAEGEPGAGAMYLLVSGRLRRSRRRADEGGTAEGEEVLGDVGRGEAVGAYAVLAEGPRAEHVVALRDSHLVRLDRALVASHPQVIARIARDALERTERPHPRPGGNGVRTIAVVPARAEDPCGAVAERLRAQLARFGRTSRLDAAAVDAAFGRDGAAQATPGTASDPALTHWLNEREVSHDHLVLQADATVTPWTERCLRQADVVLVVADAGADPAPGAAERRAAEVAADVQLVLVQADAAALPSGTARWLAARPALPHHHLRLGVDGDAARLARRLTGRAVGLVLSGGGARGYVHIGLIRALGEAGPEIDVVMGTSMGALVGGVYAMRGEYAACHDAAATFGDSGRLVDRTLPIVALTESRGVTELFRQLFAEVRIEDLWIPFACVSANLTRAEPVVHRDGPLWEAVRASTAIPGVFTPLLRDGDVLVDGGVMNAFPVDLMREEVGSGVVIGSSASSHGSPRQAYDFGPSISGWRVLLQRLSPWARRRPYPTMLGTLMRASSLSSKHQMAAARTLADLVVEYPTQAYGGLDFGRYDDLIELGYEIARDALKRLPADPEGVAVDDGEAKPSPGRGSGPRPLGAGPVV